MRRILRLWHNWPRNTAKAPPLAWQVNLPRRPRPRTLRYALSALVTVIAITLRILLRKQLGNQLAFLTFYPAVFLAAAGGGFGPGVLTTLISAFYADYYIIIPEHSLSIEKAADAVGMVVFAATGFGISFLSGMLQRTQTRARESILSLIHNAPDATAVCDRTGNILFVSAEIETLFGYSSEELLGHSIEMLLAERVRSSPDNDWPKFFADPQKRLIGADMELWAVHKCGREIPVEISFAPLTTPGGVVFCNSIRDISERRKLVEARSQLAAIIEHTDDAVIGKSITGEIQSWNKGAELLYGYTAAEVVGKPVSVLLPQGHPDEMGQILKRLARGERIISEVTERRRADGVVIHVALTVSPVRDPQGVLTGVSTIARDVSPQSKERLRRSLEEKEALLGEIHHRVKNNLQVITSLLNLQAGMIEDSTVRQVFAECQNRIHSMAFIHKQLYESARFQSIDLTAYLNLLTSHLLKSFGVQPGACFVNIDSSGAALGLDAAIPCGLILNELLSNALKHAFPESRQGIVWITCKTSNGRIALSVDDNGLPLPQDILSRTSKTMGLRLVQALVGQLDGDLRVGEPGEPKFQIDFPAMPAQTFPKELVRAAQSTS